MKAGGFNPDDFITQAKAAGMSGFNPDDFIAKAGAPAEKTSAPMAALEGFGNGALAGHLPQAQAATEKAIDWVTEKLGVGPAAVDAELRAKGIKVPEKPYVQMRDENLERQAQEVEEHPVASTAGLITGAVTSAPIYGGLGKLALGAAKAIPGIAGGANLVEAGMGAKNLGLIGRTAQSAAGGAIQGAIQNPGDTEGKIGGLQLDERLDKAKTGAEIGAVIPGGAAIIGGVGKKLVEAPGKLKDLAEKFFSRAIGTNGPQARELSMLDPAGMSGETIKKLGAFVADNKLVQAGDKPEVIANRISTFRQKVGAKIGAAYDKAEEMVSNQAFNKMTKAQKATLMASKFDRDQMIKELEQLADTQFKSGKFGDGSARQTLLKQLEDLREHPKKILSITDMQALKEAIDDKIWGAAQAQKLGMSALTPPKEPLMAIRDFLKTKMDARIAALDAAFGKKSNLGSTLTKLNKQYQMASTANTIAKKFFAREEGNKFLSLTDKMMMGAGAAGGIATGAHDDDGDINLGGMVTGALKGAALGAASKYARTYGIPAIAHGLRDSAGLIQKLPAGIPSAMQAAGGLVAAAPAAAGAMAARGLLKPDLKRSSSQEQREGKPGRKPTGK